MVSVTVLFLRVQQRVPLTGKTLVCTVSFLTHQLNAVIFHSYAEDSQLTFCFSLFFWVTFAAQIHISSLMVK